MHNRCLDWGLRKLKPGENCDPTYEMDILVEAAEHFEKENGAIDDNEIPDDPPPRRNYGPTHAGVIRRQSYIHRNYGGPPPTTGCCGRGRGRGRGGGRARGRGHGQGRGGR